MKLTEWYPPEIEPVHVGVYEREHAMEGQIRHAHWNGKEWGLWTCRGPLVATDEYHLKTRPEVTNVRWRGLAEKP